MFILLVKLIFCYVLLFWFIVICCGFDIKCEIVLEVGCYKMVLYGFFIGCDIKMCIEFRVENLVLIF